MWLTIRDSCEALPLSLACTYAESFCSSLSVVAGAEAEAEAFAYGRNAR